MLCCETSNYENSILHLRGVGVKRKTVERGINVREREKMERKKGAEETNDSAF